VQLNAALRSAISRRLQEGHGNAAGPLRMCLSGSAVSRPQRPLEGEQLGEREVAPHPPPPADDGWSRGAHADFTMIAQLVNGPISLGTLWDTVAIRLSTLWGGGLLSAALIEGPRHGCALRAISRRQASARYI